MKLVLVVSTLRHDIFVSLFILALKSIKPLRYTILILLPKYLIDLFLRCDTPGFLINSLPSYHRPRITSLLLASWFERHFILLLGFRKEAHLKTGALWLLVLFFIFGGLVIIKVILWCLQSFSWLASSLLFAGSNRETGIDVHHIILIITEALHQILCSIITTESSSVIFVWFIASNTKCFYRIWSIHAH